jgi:hypothetical protein
MRASLYIFLNTYFTEKLFKFYKIEFCVMYLIKRDGKCAEGKRGLGPEMKYIHNNIRGFATHTRICKNNIDPVVYPQDYVTLGINCLVVALCPEKSADTANCGTPSRRTRNGIKKYKRKTCA